MVKESFVPTVIPPPFKRGDFMSGDCCLGASHTDLRLSGYYYSGKRTTMLVETRRRTMHNPRLFVLVTNI